MNTKRRKRQLAIDTPKAVRETSSSHTLSTPLIYCIALNTALLVSSCAAGAKLIAITDQLTASATVFSYAFSFLLTDLISELYGKKAAKIAVNIGFVGLMLSVVIFLFSIHATPAAFWPHQDAYQQTLGQAPRILIGGWLAYLVSQNIDVWKTTFPP